MAAGTQANIWMPQTWDIDGLLLSIGTEDADALASRASVGDGLNASGTAPSFAHSTSASRMSVARDPTKRSICP